MDYSQSVELDVSKCTGCTACLKHCPTEAIRIRGGHAQINPDRCIDCGECIRACPNSAKKAQCSKVEHYMDKYKYKIAIPAPALFGQFDELDDIDYVLQGLLEIGFDDVFEVSKAVQERVKSAVENMTGIAVDEVNVKIADVNIEEDE